MPQRVVHLRKSDFVSQASISAKGVYQDESNANSPQ